MKDYTFKDKTEVRNFFIKLSGLIKNLNYSQLNTNEYTKYQNQIIELTGLSPQDESKASRGMEQVAGSSELHS